MTVPGIVTPEAVVLEFSTAGMASRGLASSIDAFIQAATLLVLAMGLGIVGGGMGLVLVYLAIFGLVFVYPAAFETLWRGRTPGKAALGLRVVTVEGAPIRFRHAAIRAIFGAVDKYALAGPGVGVIFVFVTKRNQRLGDLVAGTIVLRERSGAKAPTAMLFAPPRGLEPYVAALDVSRLSHAEYGAIRAFLLRATSLGFASRSALAQQLAFPLMQHQSAPPPPGLHPEVFLACVAAAYQLRNGGPAAARLPSFTSVWADVSGPPSATGARYPSAIPQSGAGGFEAPS
jgi:uncharacterized RDD family membrane protein YckC